MKRHDTRVTEFIAHEAASFILRESSGQSLITVNRTILSSTGERATVFVSVFPIKEIAPALTFLTRLAGDFRAHLATHSHLHPVPKIAFALDELENKS